MGHVGLTPQSYNQMSGYKIQGKTSEDAKKITADALAVENAGAFGVVLECIPENLATKITNKLTIPTIGIGAGAGVDGQVLVLHDMLGITMDFSPRFLRRYLNLSEQIEGAINKYVDDVRGGEFPNESEQY